MVHDPSARQCQRHRTDKNRLPQIAEDCGIRGRWSPGGGPLVELTSPRAVFVIAGCGTLSAMLLVWRQLLPRPSGEDRGTEGSGRAGI